MRTSEHRLRVNVTRGTRDVTRSRKSTGELTSGIRAWFLRNSTEGDQVPFSSVRILLALLAWLGATGLVAPTFARDTRVARAPSPLTSQPLGRASATLRLCRSGST